MRGYDFRIRKSIDFSRDRTRNTLGFRSRHGTSKPPRRLFFRINSLPREVCIRYWPVAKKGREKKSARKDSIIEGHCGLEFGLRHKFNSSNKTSARSDRSSLQMRDNAYCNGERRILSSFQRARPGMRLIAERISDSMARVREMSEHYANFAHSTRVDDGIKINKKAALAETAMGHGCPVLVGTI
ncbi:hypothetical protein TNCV_740411 [Trichonephila clavipes]|nr:hypothetical protein TNCV_740411 [Trichonephila clavipes]